MLIGICGSLCAGKSTVQQYLIDHHAFTPLKIVAPGHVPRKFDEVPDFLSTPDEPSPHTFATATDLLDHATQHWQQNFVTTSIHTPSDAETLSRRPLFILLSIDAPLLTRFARWQAHVHTASLSPHDPDQDLHTFLQQCDTPCSPIPTPTTLATLASHAQIKLYNTSPTLSALHISLSRLDLPSPHRLRPTWDHYFMTLASLAARRSNCMRRQVGSVLVRSNRVLSTGYNGTPRHLTNCLSGGCPRCNNPTASAAGAALDTCLCIHAEENALLEAGRERIDTGGAVLYCNTCPCLTCSIKIVQVGIEEVVFSQSYYMDEAAAGIFREAGVKLRQFSPPREGLVVLGGEGEVDGV